MGFKLKFNRVVFIGVYVCSVNIVNAAEWKSEPSVFMKAQYNDNVRMRSKGNNPEGSSGYTLEPRIKLAGEEQRLWDMSVDTRAKIIRYQDIDDGDSENLFFKFDGGRQTELTDWRLNASYSDKTNFDTDFETANSDSGIGDRTERTTISISPSVSWNTSETSQIRFGINATDVAYGKVSSRRYRDYTNNSASLNAFWVPFENHQLGFTSSYSEYDSPDAKFSYNQTVFQLDYTYAISPLSNISLSAGGRILDSLSEDVKTCVLPDGTVFQPDFITGDCPTGIDAGIIIIPVTTVVEDITNKDNGLVTNLTYSHNSETTSHRFTGGRTISPSSFGGASEIRSATYQFSIKNTERFTTRLLFDVSDSVTVNGTESSKFNDRTTYRFEPSLTYRLTQNWNLQFIYRYFNQDYATDIFDRDAASNAVYINLFLHWPKLATTY